MKEFVEVLDLSNIIKDNRYIICGDIHGCIFEFRELLSDLEYNSEKDYFICVGDLVDRGPDSESIVNWFMLNNRAYSVCGNHDDRFHRWLKGNPVKVTHGLNRTIEQFKFNDKVGSFYKEEIRDFFGALPYIIKIHNNYIVHAGFNPERDPYHQLKSDCLYMRYFGGKDFFDNKNGKYWFEYYNKSMPRVFFGHEVFVDTFQPSENVVALDGGCVFGNVLRAYDSREKIVHSVRAKEVYSGKLEVDKSEALARSKQSFLENN